MTGLSLKFYTTAYTPAVLQIRSEASVNLEQSINKSCLLACRQQTVERFLKCLRTDLVSVYYFTKNTQTHTMDTSIAASPDYLCQDTQCKSTWSEIGASLLKLSYVTAVIIRACTRNACGADATPQNYPWRTSSARQANALRWQKDSLTVMLQDLRPGISLDQNVPVWHSVMLEICISNQLSK